MTVLDTLVELVEFRTAAKKHTYKDDEDSIKTVVMFTRDDIEKALNLSLTAFNSSAPATYLKYDQENQENIMQISDILVTYASYLLLVHQSFKEKGREFLVSDQGIAYEPPRIADFIYNAACDLYDVWYQRVQEFKNSPSFKTDFLED